jgi:hypothetical protein
MMIHEKNLKPKKANHLILRIFAAGVIDTTSNSPSVSTTPAVNLPPVLKPPPPVANNGNNIRLLTP